MMAEILDELITIFPFEKKYFEKTDLNVGFAGHPLVDKMPSAADVKATDIQWKGSPKVALLPGSRVAEIRRLMPVIWKAAALLEKDHPEASFIIASTSPKTEELIRDQLDMLGKGPGNYSILTGKTKALLGQARHPQHEPLKAGPAVGPYGNCCCR